MLFFNVHNIFAFSIKGDVPSETDKYFRQELGYFFSSEEIPVNLEVELKGKIQEPPVILAPHYGRDENYFYLKDPYSNEVGIFSKSKVIAESKVNPGWLLKDIIEPLMFLDILGKGYVFLHASAVEKNSKGYIFAAFPQTGKTNILLSLLKEGYSFLSDEMVIVSQKGQVFSYPRPISLYPYNIKTYPELKKVIDRKSIMKKQKIALLSFLQKFQKISFLQNPGSLFSRALKMTYTRIAFQHFPLLPQDIGAKIGKNCPVEKVFLLVGSKELSEPILKEIEHKELFAKSLWAGIMGEKSNFFAETLFALSFIFPEKKELIAEKNLKMGESILMGAVQDAKCFQLTLPKNVSFHEIFEKCKKHFN